MNNDRDMYTKHDHNSYHSNDQQNAQVENIVDDQRSPQLNKTVCRYNHGQGAASNSDDSGNETEGGGGGNRGGGGGGCGGFVCITSPSSRDSSPAPSDDGMDVDGEEGLDLYKRTHSLHALHLLAHDNHYSRIGILPDENEYPVCFSPSPSQSGSMDVEHTETLSMCRSFAQLSTLSGATRSTTTSAFLAFAGHGMMESGTLRPMPAAHHFIGGPIFLGHERAFCFNIELGVDAGPQHHQYPVQINIDDGMSEAGRSEFSYYDLF